MSDSTTKRCSKCGQEFPATTEYFYRDRKRPDGLRSWCRQCDKVSTENYLAGNIDKARAATKRWRDANREKVKVDKQRYYYENLDRVKAKDRRWYNSNKDRVRDRSQRRRAAIRALPTTFTSKDWQRALEYFHGCCAYCSNPPSLLDHNPILHQEHFKPLSQGGGYTPDNIIPACQSCNFSKQDKDARTWLIERVGKRRAQKILKDISAYFKWVKLQT